VKFDEGGVLHKRKGVARGRKGKLEVREEAFFCLKRRRTLKKKGRETKPDSSAFWAWPKSGEKTIGRETKE